MRVHSVLISCLFVPLVVWGYLSRVLPATHRSTRVYQGRVPYVPYYPDKAKKDYMWMDIYNALGRTRTIFVTRFLDDEACNQLIASLAWLQGQSSTEPITLYFNVPGSLGKPAFAVYDMMQKMTCPLITINCGLTVGMGALLCASGSKGQRYALPNSRFLMSKTGLDDGLQGQAVGLSLGVKEVMKDNEVIISELARLCGHPRLKIEMDLTRDFYLTATEASMYGVVDSVRMPPRPFKLKWYRGSDDDVVGFGHFAEVSKVKAGPNDEVLQLSEENEEEFDDYTMREMMKKGAKGDGTLDTSRGSAERFGSSRCRPIPLAPKDKTPKKPTNGDREEDEFDKNPFKNVF